MVAETDEASCVLCLRNDSSINNISGGDNSCVEVMAQVQVKAANLELTVPRSNSIQFS